eukprot:9176388-Lingulodinium_polyedra.AAC.1
MAVRQQINEKALASVIWEDQWPKRDIPTATGQRPSRDRAATEILLARPCQIMPTWTWADQ